MAALVAVHQPLGVLVVVLVVVLVLLKLVAQEHRDKDLLVVIRPQVTIMLVAAAVLVQLEKTLTPLMVGMAAQEFAQP
jgi:uncharacterized membrane protein YbhN (UPF0104 family)